jgi:MoxR-like ATPase
VTAWHIFRGTREPHEWTLPETPPWRRFTGGPALPPPSTDWTDQRPADLERALAYQAATDEVELINVALFLRRPLLITGKPGTGKSTLAYAVAHELGLGPVLRWPITSRSTLHEGLYRYDAVGRLQEANLSAQIGSDASDVGRYLQLGPLGTALLPYDKPRVLLIDEIDKSDIDLPNDLLNIFEEGEFAIPELERHHTPEVLVRIQDPQTKATVRDGIVRCSAFPIIVMTSNGERDFPPAFLRRCVRLELAAPRPERLARIVESHLGSALREQAADVIDRFLAKQATGDLATDQLLNAVFLTAHTPGADRTAITDVVLRHLNTAG